MAKLGINTGIVPNDGLADNLLVGATKINSNFNEIYAYFGNGTNLTSVGGTWGSTSVGIHTLKNVGIGTTNPRFTLEVGAVGASGTTLFVNGNARVTGIVTIGPTSITLNGITNTVNIGAGITLNGSTGIISATAIVLGGTILTGAAVTSITAGSGISVNSSTGNVTITATGGGGSSQFVTTVAGIHTLSNVGIGTTNPTSALTVTGNAKIIGVITATSFFGDGSALTGVIGSGSGIVVKDSGSIIGTAGTIDFGDNLSVSAISAGVVTVTGSASGGGSSQFVTTSAGIHTLSNVGIGTTNPTSALTVVGASGTTLLVTGGTIPIQIGGNSVSGTIFKVGEINLSGPDVSDVNATYYSNIKYSKVGDFRYNLEFHSGGYTGYGGAAPAGGPGDFIFYKRESSYGRAERFRISGETGDITVQGRVIAASANISGFTTTTSLRGYGALVGTSSSTTTTFIVTIVSKTTNHRYYGTGSGSAYFIDGIESPFLTLLPGKTYRFNQEDASNSSHPVRFYYDADRTTQYTTNVTTSGTPGSAGAYTEIVVTDTTPVVLHYQCSNHGYMGNAIHFSSNVVDTPYQITTRSGINVTGVVTATTFIGNVTGTATTATNAQGLTGTPNITVGVATASTLNVGTGGTIITTTTAGLVGIGTTNPTSKLTVKGNTSLETLNVTGVSTLTSNVSVGGTISVDGAIKLITNNGTIVGTSGSIGEIKRIAGAPFFYDGNAWREFVLSTGTPIAVPADAEWNNVILRSTYDTNAPGFFDFKFSQHPILTGVGATTVASPVKIGTKSFRNNGSVGAGISYAYRPEHDFTGSWTIEFWINHDARPYASSTYPESMVAQISLSNANNNWSFGLLDGGYSTIHWIWNNEAKTSLSILHSVAYSTFDNDFISKWNHYALVRQSSNGSLHFYVNGYEVGITTDNSIIDNDITSTNGAGLHIGGIFYDIINNENYSHVSSIDAFFDDLRITTDERYVSVGNTSTQVFVPSITALPTTGTLSSYVQPPGDKYGEIGLGGSPTWKGTSGVTVSQQSSGNYRVSFASTYTNSNDYFVLSHAMDQGFASYVGVARSTTHVDFSINKESDNAVVNTGSLSVQIKNNL